LESGKLEMKQSRKRTAATGEGGEGGRRKALKKDGLVNDLKDQNQRELDGTGKLTKCFQCDTTLNTESGVYVLECKAVSR
jgi:hypothetical protein